MLHLRVYGSSDELTEVGEGLEADGRVRHVALVPGRAPRGTCCSRRRSMGGRQIGCSVSLGTWARRRRHRPDAPRRRGHAVAVASRGVADLGGRSRAGQAEFPTRRALPRVHDRGGRDRRIRRDRRQPDADRRSHGGEPGHSPGHRRVHRDRDPPLEPCGARLPHGGDRPWDDLLSRPRCSPSSSTWRAACPATSTSGSRRSWGS